MRVLTRHITNLMKQSINKRKMSYIPNNNNNEELLILVSCSLTSFTFGFITANIARNLN
jgi:hypothetical protein